MADPAQTRAVWDAVGDEVGAWLAGRAPKDVADDLLQEVFLKVHTRLDQLQSGNSPRPWVFQIARNAVADHYRRRPDAIPEAPEPTADLEDEERRLALRRRALGQWLKASIDKLDPRYSEVLRRTEIEGRGYAEVASELGLTRSGVKSRVQRGRALLRAELTACCDVHVDARGQVVDAQPRAPECC